MTRLAIQPGEVLDRGSSATLTWNGKRHTGFAGDTIVSALVAGGVRVFSRSFKYHRPRGVLTASHLDPNTIVQVDDEPNVRAGHRLLADGMVVAAQNAWPSLRVDARSANRLLARFLGPGFYYKTFIGPRRLRPAYQAVLRRFAAGGTVSPERSEARYEKRFAHPDVVVAGGGPAGMAAALGAADRDATVLLVEEEHHLGGHLRFGDAADRAALAELQGAVEDHPSIEVMTDAVVAGRYDHNWVAVVQRNLPGVAERLVKARAKALVVAAGTIERPYVFAGNDLPGVMLSTAVRRLVNLYAAAPGSRAVVLTANASGDAAVGDLERAGVDVAAVLDARAGQDVVAARGRGALSAVDLGDGRRVEADLLVTAVGWTTPTALLNMAGCRPLYDPAAARFLPGLLPDDVLATGGVAGDGSTGELVAHGRATGAEAARRAAGRRAAWQAATPAAAPSPPADPEPGALPPLPPAAHPELFRSTTHGFVDFSEDVTSKDLVAAVAEGYDSIELAKRFTTATMGPIQGKLEVVNSVAVHAAAVGATIAETGTTTWRPPTAPVTLGALAGHDEDPVRRSPMHEWHAAHGATPIVAGQWIRPEHYGDPAAEVGAVRTGVGVIDVSPLGRLDLRGRDVPKLLEFVYANRWSRLAVGRVRYGVMCAEDGVVMDDGVTARLGEDRYFMTTTSGGAGRVWNWLDEWLQTRFAGWDVRVTAVTDGYAGINVAGPRSRELLGRLVDGVDVSREAFPYLHAREGTVAGAPGCKILRIGFTGELSFELHVPAGYGLAVWDALLDAGSDLGVAPFGLEAQRIMRLEKGHLIVGQDTDGLTQAHSADLGWTVRLDKDDFAGKPELVWESERGVVRRLVALQPADPALVPPEASQIVAAGAPRGRVTSSRWSPALGRAICLGMLDAELAVPGATVTVRLPDGTDAVLVVMERLAHFDPDGERLRG